VKADEQCVWHGLSCRKACEHCRTKKLRCNPAGISKARDGKSRERDTKSANLLHEIAYDLDEWLVSVQELILVNTKAINSLRSDLCALPRSIGGILYNATHWGLSGLRVAQAQNNGALALLLAEVGSARERLRNAEDDNDNKDNEDDAKEDAVGRF
jgi:hypothetical protein